MNKWEEAIAINKVDGIDASKYLQELIEENKKGNITTKEIIERLKKYYEK